MRLYLLFREIKAQLQCSFLFTILPLHILDTFIPSFSPYDHFSKPESIIAIGELLITTGPNRGTHGEKKSV